MQTSSNVNLRVIKKTFGQAQRQMDIAQSGGIPLKEILTFEHCGESLLFIGEITTKPDKSSLVKELEKFLEPSDYHFDRNNDVSTCIVIDFMSMIRKVRFAKMVSINDVFQNLWQSVVSISIFDTIHIVYDSYTDDSIKECERMRRSTEVDPLEYVKLTGRSPVPVK